MSKLAWVVLPLLGALALLAWLALRRRTPSRLALNVWTSVLLLVYLGTTAGLGIFWVANQHLPVFDWHYLFGYATVALLLVHLAFNFRIVWRHWTQRARPVTPAASVPVVQRRLPVLGALGLLFTGAGAFWLGLRHGRTELQVMPAAAGAGDAGLAVVERFHEFSAHSRGGVFRRAPGVDWGDPPPPFKAYPGAPVLRLPAPRMTLADASAATAGSLDMQALATLLHACAGVNLERGGIHFRCSPSSGALFATELYLRVRRVPGLGPGLYHYDGREHLLHRLPGPGGMPDIAAPVQLVASALFRRSGHKYRDRAYRYILADLGHLLENLRAGAEALGVPAGPVVLFDESALARELGLDEAEEGVLALWTLGAAEPGLAVLASPAAAATQRRAGWQPPPLAASQPLGVTDAIHRATSLRVPTAPASTAPSPRIASADGPVITLPAPARTSMPTLQRIERRRSQRRYASSALTLAQLSALLDAMARRVPPQLSRSVQVHVLSAAVEGLPTAAWRYEPARHALRQSRASSDLRRQARSAALDQDVIGDAAATFVLALDRAAFAADAAGPARGYRHAFIEAGLMGGRLYLEATALGLHTCGVGAFYDDEAAALLALDAREQWVVHFAAVGVPA
jgi:SagB-type dehydrogenase family enzyme